MREREKGGEKEGEKGGEKGRKRERERKREKGRKRERERERLGAKMVSVNFFTSRLFPSSNLSKVTENFFLNNRS